MSIARNRTSRKPIAPRLTSSRSPRKGFGVAGTAIAATAEEEQKRADQRERLPGRPGLGDHRTGDVGVPGDARQEERDEEQYAPGRADQLAGARPGARSAAWMRVRVLDSMKATCRQAAATAVPEGSGSNPVATSARIPSIASVAGER